MGMVSISLEDVQQLVKEALAEGNQDKLDHAESTLVQITNHDPDNWLPLFHLASLYLHRNYTGVAISLFHRANELSGGKIPEVLNNIGAGYRKENKAEKAEYYFKEAMKYKPQDPDMYNNIGSLHINNGDPEVAESYFRKALELAPAHTYTHWNLGLALLEQEKFGSGFDEYAWGQFSKDRMSKDYHHAVWWDGEPNPNKTLVIYGEQGIGDEIMFAEMINDVAALFGGRIILDVHPRLIHLFERAFPWATCYPTRKELGHLDWADEEQPDYKVAMGTMGKYVRRTESAFSKTPYLTAKRELVDEYKQWLQLTGPGPYIGLGWVGGHKKTRKDLRAVHLPAFQPLFDALPNATYVSVQYTDHGREDTQALFEETGQRVWHFPEVTEASMWEYWELIREEDGEVLGRFEKKDVAKQYKRGYDAETRIEHHAGPGYDFDDFAAWVTAIHELGGIIVSINTSAVHLCGALGVRCLTLTPSKPAWRYGLNREDMVMYSEFAVKQYRQQGSDWTPAIEAMVEDMKKIYQQTDVAAGETT